MSGTNCISKKYRVPFFNYVLKDKTVLKYMDRPAKFKSLTLTEYSRYQQDNCFTNILSTLFAIHIFYLPSVIHLWNNTINTCLTFFTKLFSQHRFFSKILNTIFQIDLFQIFTAIQYNICLTLFRKIEFVNVFPLINAFLIFRQFKTADDIPAPFKSNTNVLLGIII